MFILINQHHKDNTVGGMFYSVSVRFDARALLSNITMLN
jgi:hypothetical protein